MGRNAKCSQGSKVVEKNSKKNICNPEPRLSYNSEYANKHVSNGLSLTGA